jgi:hypothetical protein
MNREFNPTTMSIRTLFAAAAVFAMVMVAGSIEGLAVHYHAGTTLATTTSITVVAQR